MPDPDLSYYIEGSIEYENYMRDLEWAQTYALENREEMLRRVMEVISHHVGKKGAPLPYSLKVNSVWRICKSKLRAWSVVRTPE